jgi:hypothetical protein
LALFFYGTLMDPEVLATVLARPVGPAELVPATLPGWRRVRALNVSYPLLCAEPAATVDGLLFRRPSARDRARIGHFESQEYEPAAVTVLGPDGGAHPADVFLALDAAFETDGASWELATWAAEHKAAFLARCAVWMADCPEPARADGLSAALRGRGSR